MLINQQGGSVFDKEKHNFKISTRIDYGWSEDVTFKKMV